MTKLLLSLGFFYSLSQASLTTASVIPSNCESIVETEFKSSTWWINGWTGGMLADLSLPTPYISRTDDPTCISHSGCSTVLQWTVPKDLHSSARFMSKKLNRTEVWASFKLFVPDTVGGYDLGSDQNDINKLPGFAGGGGGDKDNAETTGENGWSARMGWRVDHSNNFSMGYYTYHVDKKTNHGEWMGWNHETNRDQWMTITQRIKVNSLNENDGNNDGLLEAYVDDQLVYSREDIRFTDVPDFSDVKRYWFSVYFGGSQTAPHRMSFYFDQLKVCGMPQEKASRIDKIWPNPMLKDSSREFIHAEIKISKSGPYQFLISDLTGKFVSISNPVYFEKGSTEYDVKLPSSLNAGMYLLYSSFGYNFSGGVGSEISEGVKLIVL